LWQFWRKCVNASSSTGERASCRTTLSWFICWQASQGEENIHEIFMFWMMQYNLCHNMSICWMKNPQYRLFPTYSVSTFSKTRLKPLIERAIPWNRNSVLYPRHMTSDTQYFRLFRTPSLLSCAYFQVKFRCMIKLTHAQSHIIQFITFTGS
jgi:hypothetical protein